VRPTASDDPRASARELTSDLALVDEAPRRQQYIDHRPVVNRPMHRVTAQSQGPSEVALPETASLTIGWLSTYCVGVELRPPSYFALAALIDGPLHGYAISQRARELSGGRVRLSTGTLYALLERALSESLVIAGEPYVEGGRQRRDYTLTLAGRAQLADEAARLAHAAKAVSSRLRATSEAVLT
jgi:PadR family transcriptional regulator, regulatory protein PadR